VPCPDRMFGTSGVEVSGKQSEKRGGSWGRGVSLGELRQGCVGGGWDGREVNSTVIDRVAGDMGEVYED
jgi:hypothetical protein